MNRKIRHIWSEFSQDNKGTRVLWQWPNPPIIGWAVFRIAAHLVNSAGLKAGFEFIGSAFLFTWAYMEIAQGASYFRRVLGAIVAILLCLSYFR